MRVLYLLMYFIIAVGLGNCNFKRQKTDLPNFLFITCEDISPYLSFYGDSTAKTPALDKLAEQSLIYDNAFATVGVCAPSRSSVITGMYPISIGTHNMRTGQDIFAWGRRSYKYEKSQMDQAGNEFGQYAVVTPPEVKCFTKYLREKGYFCTNNAKTDYQFSPPLSAWDENGKTAHFAHREDNQPFFAVFNFEVSHESQIWMKAEDSLRIDPAGVSLHAYWQDTDTSRLDMARNYSNIEELDQQISELIDELVASGSYENTYIFFFSDHGGPLPRGKRAIYDSGLKVPFMVSLPGERNYKRTTQMISFVDIAPTVLSLAEIEVPAYMQGKAFLGVDATEEREFIYGSGDRFDESYDRVRCIRDKQYMLVKNYYTDQPRYLDVAYRKQIPMMREMLRLRDSGQLDSTQMIWFEPSKPAIELYDTKADPDQVRNIAHLSENQDRLISMLTALNEWEIWAGDLGGIPEAQLVLRQWPNFEQPKTQMPQVELMGDRYQAEVNTEGADIVYRYSQSNDPISELDHWMVYTGYIEKRDGLFLHVRATRIGYVDSETVVIKM